FRVWVMTRFFDAMTTIYCRERKLSFNKLWRKRVLTQTLQPLEREAGKLERRADVSKGDTATEARGALRTRRSELKEISDASEVGLIELKRMLGIILRGEAG